MDDVSKCVTMCLEYNLFVAAPTVEKHLLLPKTIICPSVQEAKLCADSRADLLLTRWDW